MSYFHLGGDGDEVGAHPSDRATHERSHSTVSSPCGECPLRLLVTPKEAFDALSIGNTLGYELIGSGALEAVKVGRATRIRWASVEAFAGTAPRWSDDTKAKLATNREA